MTGSEIANILNAEWDPSQVKKNLPTEDIFTEEYIGQIPELKAVSILFDKMLEEAKADPNKMNPNKWPENNKIRAIFKKFFGLKAFHLYWVPSDVRNAFTFTDSALLAGEKRDGVMTRRSGKGFYDTEHQAVFLIFVYVGCLRPEVKFTGRELTAIILHELGHNLDFSPYFRLGIFNRLWLKLVDKSAVEANNDFKDEMLDYFKDVSEDIYEHQKRRDRDRKRDERNMEAYMNSPWFVNAIYGAVAGVYNAVFFFSGAAFLTQSLITGRRKGEQFADSFATAYGYGPDLMTGLLKLGDYSKYIKKNGVLDNFFRDYADAANEIAIMLMDEHSSNQSRCKDCLTKLRKDLKRGDYPPDMREDLMAELRTLEEIYHKIVYEDTKGKPFTAAWRKFINTFFGGHFEITRILPKNQM